MNNKLFKLGLSIGSIGAVAAPIVTVVSCGGLKFSTIEFGGHSVKALNTGGYSGSMNRLATNDISIAGAWGDSRFYAEKKVSKLHVVGVEKKRITNDGIQVKGDMKVSDQIALQLLFKDLIKYSNDENNKDLRMDFDGKEKSVFNIYSHANYKALKGDDDVSLIDPQAPKGPLKTSKAGTGNNRIVTGSTFTAANSDFFSVATSGATTKTTLTSNYSTKENKKLKIVFIPSNDASKVTAATSKLQAFLKSIGVNANITVSTDYDSAASSLEAKQIDVAFLPAETWSKSAPSSKFIIQASRPVQIATLNVSGTTAELPSTSLANEKDAVELFNKYGQLYLKDVKTSKLATIDSDDKQKAAKDLFKTKAAKNGTVEKKIQALADSTTGDDLLAGSYEAWLYTKKDSDLDKLLKDKYKKANWTMPYADVKDKVIYGYTSTTSSASYLFPELWFNEHFTK